MTKLCVVGVLATLSAALAFAAQPDVKTDESAAYARRGSLGANDYVATNVYPCVSAYRLNTVTDTALADRSVNSVTLSGDASFAMPPVRVDGGFARAFVMFVKVPGTTPCKITFTGATKIVARGGVNLVFDPGESIVSVLELEDGVYLVEKDKVGEVGE